MRPLSIIYQIRRRIWKPKWKAALDYLITDEEFEAAINKLKANKSPGIDNILNEVIKIGKDAIEEHLVN